MGPKLREKFHLTTGESIEHAGVNSPVITILKMLCVDDTSSVDNLKYENRKLLNLADQIILHNVLTNFVLG